VVREPKVLRGVGDDQRARLKNGLLAETAGARHFGDTEPEARLEPHSILIDEGDDGGGRAANLRRQAREPVEVRLRTGVEHSVAMERVEPCPFAVGLCGLHDATRRQAGGPVHDTRLASPATRVVRAV